MHRVIHASAATLVMLAFAGCRQDMQDQPKFFPQRGTTMYTDGRSVRPQVPGTVARSQGDAESYFLTGKIDGKEGDALPFPVTTVVMARGQERFNIYCSPCHSRVGNGLGMVVQRGYHEAGDFHSERLRAAPLGHFFSVMTNGLGAMPDYAAQLTPQDRWAVAAYIRALQLSQNAKPADAAPGAKTASIEEVAARVGMPASFAGPWSVSGATVASVPAVVTPVAPAAAATLPGARAVMSANGPMPAGVKAAVVPGKAATALARPAAVAAAPVGDAAAGQVVYTQHCQMCHQAARTGLPPNIPSLVGIVGKVGEPHIRSVVANGIPAGIPPMPAFPTLSTTDVDNLLAFLRTGK